MPQHVTACHSMSQHVTAPQLSTGSKSTSRLAGSTWLWLKEAKSMLKIAPILRSLAICIMSSIRFPMLPSNPLYKPHPIISNLHFGSNHYFPIFFRCFNRVNPGYNRVYLYVFPWRSIGLFVDLSSTRSGPHQVRPSVWDLRCFGIARPEPRPGTFISGQETLASVP